MGAWGKSKAKAFLEAGNVEDFLHEAFDSKVGFVRINGEISRGLVRRRGDEARLFASEDVVKEGGFGNMIRETLKAINPIGSAKAADVETASLSSTQQFEGPPADAPPLRLDPKNFGDSAKTAEETLPTPTEALPALGVEREALVSPAQVIQEISQPLAESDQLSVVPTPARLLVASNLPFAEKITYGDGDVDLGSRKVMFGVMKKADEVGINFTTYEMYPPLENGLSAKALVGDATKWDSDKKDYVRDSKGKVKYFADVRAKLAAEREKFYPKGAVGKAKLLADMTHDPVLRAIYTVGRFSIQSDGKGNRYIAERWNFNSASQTSGDAVSQLRKFFSNLGSASVKEGSGPLVALLLEGNLTTEQIEDLHNGGIGEVSINGGDATLGDEVIGNLPTPEDAAKFAAFFKMNPEVTAQLDAEQAEFSRLLKEGKVTEAAMSQPTLLKLMAEGMFGAGIIRNVGGSFGKARLREIIGGGKTTPPDPPILATYTGSKGSKVTNIEEAKRILAQTEKKKFSRAAYDQRQKKGDFIPGDEYQPMMDEFDGLIGPELAESLVRLKDSHNFRIVLSEGGGSLFTFKGAKTPKDTPTLLFMKGNKKIGSLTKEDGRFILDQGKEGVTQSRKDLTDTLGDVILKLLPDIGK